ncbi:50S ribosomal protein L9 [bacterium BMS3Abin07]|nr:50S ribosomal protein L9 [bacterium BMS3Abin07]GBE32063.1 50S ribosomal protein L9 [bacterium BMS3Bbin05]HDO21528.1 50S ribosomal protein L9 [Nitrospirota bacterium]HDZ88721.1 50S ribosomal protein L9 [Nitrospirota bacterium]
MKVILKEDIDNLGDIGEVVNVADGYARNYLIPRKIAVEANPKNIKQFEHIKKTMAAKIEKVKKEKQSLAEKLSSIKLSFTVKAGEDGKLFGSITNMDIQKELSAQGIDIDKKKIVVDPIKRTGEYDIRIKLHADIAANIKAEVNPE